MFKQSHVIGVIGTAFAIGATASAADLHVPGTFPTIQSAIDAAAEGDVVIVADGVYAGTGNRDISFQGKAITVRSANGPGACILTCDGTQVDPHRGFSFLDGEGRDSILEGFAIVDGSTPPGAVIDTFNGAAILCNQSSPTIRNCVLRDNWAGCWGGAICCSTNSHPLIDGCTFYDNYSNDDGGALFAWNGSSPVIQNCMIYDNESRVTGGGITNFSGSMVVRNTTIVGNIAPVGSGLYGWNTNVTSSIIVGNTGSDQVVGSPVVTFSNIEGGYEGAGNVDMPAGFRNAAAGDYRLAYDSPMINAGDPFFFAAPGESDFEGDERVITKRVDIGADERHRRGDVNRDNAVDTIDLIMTLAAWGPCAQGSDCPEDGNEDFMVDVVDLLDVLSNWGS